MDEEHEEARESLIFFIIGWSLKAVIMKKKAKK